MSVPKTKAVGESVPCCPWCGAWMEDAFVRLDDVYASLMPSGDGGAYICGLPVVCSACEKPSKFEGVVRRDEGRSWLTGERTDADKKYLGIEDKRN